MHAGDDRLRQVLQLLDGGVHAADDTAELLLAFGGSFESAAIAAVCATSASIIARSSVFIESGRFSVMVATGPSRESRSVEFMVSREVTTSLA